MGRIITPDGMMPTPDGGKRPPNMQERLQAALDFWGRGDKDSAFATALNAIAFQSQGLASMARLVKRLEESNADLLKKVKALYPTDE